MTRVSSEQQIADFVGAARQSRTPFEIVGGGTRRNVGRPMADLPVLDVSGVSGIIEYQPEELMVTARPGTTLSELRAVLAEKNQCLGFDPMAWRLLGGAGDATLGGAMSCDASGPGRLRFGPPRDSLLGFRGVNGFAQAFQGGAKVVKNVTGFDLPKLVCGAFGTLVILSELTFRVFPKPRNQATLILRDLDAQSGFAMLRTIWKSALEPSGLSYIPGSANFPGLGDIGQGAALIRFEAQTAPLSEKLVAARALVGGGEDIADGDAVFTAIGEGALFTKSDLDIWRVMLPPSEAARVAAQLGAPLWLGDWAGGLLWVGAPADQALQIRLLASQAGGHAMLLRAPAARRALLGVYPPAPPALAELEQRVKAAFDPLKLFNPGRL